MVTEPDADFMAWLSQKPVEWHQQLYALLYKELEPEGDLHRLKESGSFASATAPTASAANVSSRMTACHDEVLPRVDAAVYASGKSKTQQDNARKFLEEVGVREVGEAEQVEAILKRRYGEETEIPDEKTYLKDLKRFVTFVEQQPDKAELFDEYWIFECQDGKWANRASVSGSTIYEYGFERLLRCHRRGCRRFCAS